MLEEHEKTRMSLLSKRVSTSLGLDATGGAVYSFGQSFREGLSAISSSSTQSRLIIHKLSRSVVFRPHHLYIFLCLVHELENCFIPICGSLRVKKYFKKVRGALSSCVIAVVGN